LIAKALLCADTTPRITSSRWKPAGTTWREEHHQHFVSFMTKKIKIGVMGYSDFGRSWRRSCGEGIGTQNYV
jgi:hypothetical protein